MAYVKTLPRTSARRVTFRMDEVLNRFMRAGVKNEFRARIIITTRCSRSISSDVSLLDSHADKFQLRGIDLLNRASLARTPVTDFFKYFFSQLLEKPIPIAEVEPASSLNNPDYRGLIGSRSPLTTLP